MSKLKILILILISAILNSCGRSSEESFSAFFGFPPTRDVKNLNSYADEFGIDVDYWLAFECDDSTIQKIVSHLQLKQDSLPSIGLFGGLNMKPTQWWDTALFSMRNHCFEKRISYVGTYGMTKKEKKHTF